MDLVEWFVINTKHESFRPWVFAPVRLFLLSFSSDLRIQRQSDIKVHNSMCNK